MKQLDAEEVRHEADVWVEVEDLRDVFGRGDGVRHAVPEGRGGGPEVGVFEEADGVPLAADKNA